MVEARKLGIFSINSLEQKFCIATEEKQEVTDMTKWPWTIQTFNSKRTNKSNLSSFIYSTKCPKEMQRIM